ncbi:hypothetical protein KAU45_05755 [bacterium]|nr:hypothetical protein [bacterium]
MDVLEAIVVDEFDDDFEGVHRQSIRFKARDDLFGLICRLFHFHGSLSLVPVIPVGEAVPEVETSPEVQVVPDEVEDCWFIVGEGYMLVRDDAVWHTYQKAVSEEEPVKGPFYLVEFEEALGLDGKIVDFNLVDDTSEPYLTVTLRDEYATELEDLTRDSLGRRLAIVIDDDEVVTTIAINEVVENGQLNI